MKEREKVIFDVYLTDWLDEQIKFLASFDDSVIILVTLLNSFLVF
jgi:hypothetical protein